MLCNNYCNILEILKIFYEKKYGPNCLNYKIDEIKSS